MNLFAPLTQAIPVDQPQTTLGNLQGSALPLMLCQLAARHQGLSLLMTADTTTALKLEAELLDIARPSGLPVLLFPDWETLPYDNFSPHQDIISQRLETLYRLPQMARGILIVPMTTAMHRLAPPSFLQGNTLLLTTGESRDPHQLRVQLEQAGYSAVDQVIAHGEFSQRGSILDIFPMGSKVPYRIDYIDDEVDSIRHFDPETQRSSEQVKQIRLLPAQEFPTDSKAIEQFRSAWRDQFGATNAAESIYQQVSKRVLPAGIEYYQPLFFSQTAQLFDYLPDDTQLLTVGDLNSATDRFWQDVSYRFEERRYDKSRPIMAPEQLFMRVEEFFGQLKGYRRLHCQHEAIEEKAGRLNLACAPLPNIAVEHQLTPPTRALEAFLADTDERVLFSVESPGRREALLELLGKQQLKPREVDSIDAFLGGAESLGVLVTPLESSVQLPQLGLALICEAELFGIKVSQRRRRDRAKAQSSEAIVRSLAELSHGQPVVHYDHGVGRYLGLEHIEHEGISAEYLTLEYANNAKLYVPVSSLHLISRYSGSSEETAPLHKLGSETWQKAKRKAAEKVRDVAAELLEIYAQRNAKPGYGFAIAENDYQNFASGFPFEETPDQQNAILNVIKDMEANKAMDRLVCGDVGFGKTEVAMRAAFVAVNDGKQVAILVPTTLLAQQHFENFRDRFAQHAVKVEQLSRFRSAKQQQEALSQLAEGKIDIVIGTHKLLQPEIKFDQLGLLIVDEEHRFGVRQKEKIKALRADVDILTLTATPIPRTLNMAMSGMRDLSIIASPPARRLAVNTFVREYDEPLIKEAVRREIMRGGQVYFLHNDVSSIEQQAEVLEAMIPEARIAIAHGQMRERELEKIMTEFYHQRYNLLLCTTIIETGIDIPTANTIIINRADKFGLAQLHQLRGRVGRSHHQAYAYLLTPHPKRMTKDASKRLEAIESLKDLGAGFVLATHDLEIRGAGELLGDDQSGQIQSIGFSLYMEMLEEATQALQQGKEPSLEELLHDQSEVELKLAALLPESYIHDVSTRLSLYKRIANCKDQSQLDELQVELIDRFGLLPDAAKNLFAITGFKQRAQLLGIKRLEAGPLGGQIEFCSDTRVDAGYLIGLLQQQPAIYRMDGPNKLKFLIKAEAADERLQLVAAMMDDFERHTVEN